MLKRWIRGFYGCWKDNIEALCIRHQSKAVVAITMILLSAGRENSGGNNDDFTECR